MTARPLFKVDRNVDWEARCRQLTLELAAAKVERDEAVREANRFHALLLAERIRNLKGKDTQWPT